MEGPVPLALVIQRRYFFAVPVTASAEGYQPVGMYIGWPATRAPVRPSRTSTALAPARATNSVLPSGDSASASGWAPTGAPSTGRTDSVATTRGVPRTSSTEMESSLVLATNNRVRAADSSTAEGWWPTRVKEISFGRAG